MKLFLRLRFCPRTHPVQFVDVLVHRLLDSQCHFQRALFFLRRKILSHICLPQRLAKFEIHAAGAALPPLLLFFRTVQNVRIKIPILMVETFRQACARVSVQQLPTQICLDPLHRRICDQAIKFRKELWLRIVELARRGCMCSSYIIDERKVRQLF